MHQSMPYGHLILWKIKKGKAPEMKNRSGLALLAGILALVAAGGWAQQKPDEIPDAPSAAQPLPPPPPPGSRPGPEETAPETPADQSAPVPKTSTLPTSNEPPRSTSTSPDQPQAPPPMPPVTTVPAGSVPRDSETHEEL